MSSYNSATYELTTRRRYTREEKEAMVAEASREGSVSAVARRHRVAPAQRFRWEKGFAPAGAGGSAAGSAEPAAPATFVPAVLAPAVRKRKASPPRRAQPSEGVAQPVEIAFPSGCVLRAPANLDEAALARRAQSAAR